MVAKSIVTIGSKPLEHKRIPAPSELKEQKLHPTVTDHLEHRASLKRDHKRASRSQSKRNLPECYKQAYKALDKALSSGRLVSGPCEAIMPDGRQCGSMPTEGHHVSYAQENQLDVIWLCDRHHRRVWLNSDQGRFNTSLWLQRFGILQVIP